MANMANIEDKLKILPALPGCYLMKNKDKEIIYVGKAKKLKNRVRQYFIGAHDFKTHWYHMPFLTIITHKNSTKFIFF